MIQTMLHFLRDIRRRLIVPDNIRKYLLYAVGEVFLVVIGILIALQVNNWNENNKTSAREHKLTSSLKEEVKFAGETADIFIESEESNIEALEYTLSNWSDLSYDTIKDQFRPFQRDYFSTLFNLSGYSHFYDPRMDLYKSAVNDGSISIIQDKIFTRRLDVLYNYTVPRINELMKEEYLLAQSINDHIANRYDTIFLKGSLKDSLLSGSNIWTDETYQTLFNEMRKDGVLKYKLAHRIELKRSRLLLIGQAKRLVEVITSE